jgi:hypothetical protein
MVTICGFLCLSRKPRSVILEAAVALITLYFGFFGVFRLGAYVDVALIICALFLIVRLGSYLTCEHTLVERKEGIESKLQDASYADRTLPAGARNDAKTAPLCGSKRQAWVV